MGRGGPGGGMGMQPSVILLKEDTYTSQGKTQLISNINACAADADIVRTTLGPRGMDKLIHHNGQVKHGTTPRQGKPWSQYAWRELLRQDIRGSGRRDAEHTFGQRWVYPRK